MTTKSQTDPVVEAREAIPPGLPVEFETIEHALWADVIERQSESPFWGNSKRIAAFYAAAPDLISRLCEEVEKYKELFRAEREARNADATDIRSSIVSLIEAKATEWEAVVASRMAGKAIPQAYKAAAARELIKLIGEIQ